MKKHTVCILNRVAKDVRELPDMMSALDGGEGSWKADVVRKVV